MKIFRKITFLTACITAALNLTACTKTTEANTVNDTVTDSSDKIRIVTTIFPEYDWVMQILGDQADNAEVTMLLDNGVDLHSYQPSVADIAKIGSCDIFIYVGGESDEWVEDVLAAKTNPDLKAVNLLEVLGDRVKEEEIVEGMESEEEHEEAEGDSDEHVWLSLKNADVLVDEIANDLASIDSANADTYKANAAAYKEELGKLDNEYAEMIESSSLNTVIVADRFPFRYLVDDYDLNYYAAFAGCSAESEASFETILFLADKVSETGTDTILVTEGKNHSIAETVAQNAGLSVDTIAVMDSLQSTTTADRANGTTYLSVMQQNLSVLKEALN